MSPARSSVPSATWNAPTATAIATPALMASPTTPLRIMEMESCAIVAR